MCVYVCSIGSSGCSNGSLVITQEELDQHNQQGEDEAWMVMHGKVYNVGALSKEVN